MVRCCFQHFDPAGPCILFGDSDLFEGVFSLFRASRRSGKDRKCRVNRLRESPDWSVAEDRMRECGPSHDLH